MQILVPYTTTIESNTAVSVNYCMYIK